MAILTFEEIFLVLIASDRKVEFTTVVITLVKFRNLISNFDNVFPGKVQHFLLIFLKRAILHFPDKETIIKPQWP